MAPKLPPAASACVAFLAITQLMSKCPCSCRSNRSDSKTATRVHSGSNTVLHSALEVACTDASATIEAGHLSDGVESSDMVPVSPGFSFLKKSSQPVTLAAQPVRAVLVGFLKGAFTQELAESSFA